jgi:hypothetical protein
LVLDILSISRNYIAPPSDEKFFKNKIALFFGLKNIFAPNKRLAQNFIFTTKIFSLDFCFQNKKVL